MEIVGRHGDLICAARRPYNKVICAMTAAMKIFTTGLVAMALLCLCVNAQTPAVQVRPDDAQSLHEP